MKSLWIIGPLSDNSKRDMGITTIFRRLALLILSLCLSSAGLSTAGLYAQSNEIFSPFASGLRAKSTESGIVLTWRDSTDLFETYHIFRHTEEIDESNFDQALEVGTVPPGTSTFTDQPPDTESYFYLVLLEDPEGGLYELFIPFRNKTIIGVASQSIAGEEELAARISGLEARAGSDSIRLSFRSSRGDRRLTIYRHTEPIDSVDDLLAASRVALIESDQTSYSDFPIPNISYYYAIFDTKLIQTGTFIFNPGDNSTAVGVRIAGEANRSGLGRPDIALRSPPLPRIMLQRGIQSGELLANPLSQITPDTRVLSPEARSAVDELLASLPPRSFAEPEARILAQHLNGEFEGAAYTLSLILKEQFARGQYASTVESLRSFLSIRREEEVEIAARFYLGQALYLTGSYRDAFLEFLLAEEYYYPEVQVWIDRIYDILRKEEQTQSS